METYGNYRLNFDCTLAVHHFLQGCKFFASRLRDLEVSGLLHEICLIWYLSSDVERCQELGWWDRLLILTSC